jgi:hypothetical protein
MKKDGWIRGGDHPFRVLLLIVVLINVPILARHIWFEHDSNYLFQAFFGFYNQLFYHGTLSGWLPYTAWGVPAQWPQLSTFTPFTYLTTFVSVLMRVRDVQWVLKFSALIDHIAFLMGAYLLARRILKHRWAATFTTLGIVTSTVWIYQVYWDFRFYYLVPFIFYFLHRFWEEQKPHWLWLCGIVTTYSMLGNLPYFAPLYTLIIIIYSVFHFRKFCPALFFDRSWGNLVFFILLLISASAYLYMATHEFDHLTIQRHARDPETGQITLNVFLTFGENMNWGKFLGVYFPRAGQINGHIYIGILGLIFVVYRLVRQEGRTRTFWAIFTLSVFFALFSMGEKTPIAMLTYYAFPPIRYLRYLGDMSILLRPLLMLLAGFGLDQFLSDVARSQESKLRITPQWMLLGCALTVIGLGFFMGAMNVDSKLHPFRWPDFFYFSLFLAFVGAYLITRIVKNPRWLGLVATLFLGIDLLVFHSVFMTTWTRKILWTTDQMVEVSEFGYQASRTREPNLNPRMKEARRLAEARPNMIERNHYLQWDPCIPYRHNGFWVPGVFEYIKADHIIGNLKKPRQQLQRHLSIIMPIVGCGPPKLRLISFNVSVPDLKTAKQLVFQDPTMYQRIVFHEPLKSERVGSNELLPSDALGAIDVKSFTFNKLVAEVRVDDPRGAWLFYPDGYHPGWKAYVDGKQVPIELANLGFKAIALKQGVHHVQFVYFFGIQSVFSYLLAILGMLFATSVLLAVAWKFFAPETQKIGDKR